MAARMFPAAQRPLVMGMRHVVACGHHLAAQAALEILEAGGNAVDAGVAAGICAGVLESEYVSFAGVAPIMLYLAGTREIVTIAGVGPWPRLASCEFFRTRCGGTIPAGLLRTVVPAAPDAWITALLRYGTLSFGDVSAAAIRFARGGFPMYDPFRELIAKNAATFAAWPTTAPIFLPNGRVPEIGEVFIQEDLGKTLQFMADEEKAHLSEGREAGLAAARAAFYTGDIADAIVRFHIEHEALLRHEDMAAFRVPLAPPVRGRFGDIDVYGCGPWCQGPVLLQQLGLVEGFDLRGMGHNSAAYLHVVAEAIKVAIADRDAYYGDPDFVDVPVAELLDLGYAAERRRLIRLDEAWIDEPPPGRTSVPPGRPAAAGAGDGTFLDHADTVDTSYICVVDRHGNAFSATPSDGSVNSPIVPGTGLFVSPRGSSAWVDPAHPCAVAPGKRPRLTPNPALAIREGEFVMPFGTPGGDVQTQAMLQAFLNMTVFGMTPQQAVEMPRIATFSFPYSFEPHDSHPGRLNVEPGIDDDVVHALRALGHRIVEWPRKDRVAGSVCAIRHDLATDVRQAGADPRRAAYAVGY